MNYKKRIKTLDSVIKENSFRIASILISAEDGSISGKEATQQILKLLSFSSRQANQMISEAELRESFLKFLTR